MNRPTIYNALSLSASWCRSHFDVRDLHAGQSRQRSLQQQYVRTEPVKQYKRPDCFNPAREEHGDQHALRRGRDRCGLRDPVVEAKTRAPCPP